MTRAWRTTVVAVSLGVSLGGCSVVSRPDAKAWDDHAEQALSDAVSEVGTARLALDTARADRAWSSYTVVLVAQAEEAIGTVQQDLSRLQVPAARTTRAARVERLLDDAATAIRQARAHAVAGRYDDQDLRGDLEQVGRRLEREAGG